MNHKHLLKLLEHGAYVVVSRDKYYMIFSPFKNNSEGWKCSYHWQETIDDCKNKIGLGVYSSDNLETDCKNWTLVEAYYQPFKPFEVGQRVKVIETGEEGIIYNKAGIQNYHLNKNGLPDFNTYYHHTELLPLEEETTITLSECSSEELLQEVKRRNLVEVKEFQTLKDYIREN